MGETIPKESNQVTLDQEKVDEWGIPLLNIDVDYDENDNPILPPLTDIIKSYARTKTDHQVIQPPRHMIMTRFILWIRTILWMDHGQVLQ